MKVSAVSELEIKLIGRELLLNAASAVGIRQAWLLENQELKACLAENHPKLTQLLDQYIEALWSCHFFAKTAQDPLPEAEQQRYSDLISQKNRLRHQLADSFPVPGSASGKL